MNESAAFFRLDLLHPLETDVRVFCEFDFGAVLATKLNAKSVRRLDHHDLGVDPERLRCVGDGYGMVAGTMPSRRARVPPASAAACSKRAARRTFRCAAAVRV